MAARREARRAKWWRGGQRHGGTAKYDVPDFRLVSRAPHRTEPTAADACLSMHVSRCMSLDACLSMHALSMRLDACVSMHASRCMGLGTCRLNTRTTPHPNTHMPLPHHAPAAPCRQPPIAPHIPSRAPPPHAYCGRTPCRCTPTSAVVHPPPPPPTTTTHHHRRCIRYRRSGRTDRRVDVAVVRQCERHLQVMGWRCRGHGGSGQCRTGGSGQCRTEGSGWGRPFWRLAGRFSCWANPGSPLPSLVRPRHVFVGCWAGTQRRA